MSRLADRAYEQIRLRIVSGQLPAGTALTETALAEELQVSRTPVREAIRRLEAEGLLDQRPNRGTFVRKPDWREVQDLYEMRIFLEPIAAARAARRRRPGVIRQLQQLHAEMCELRQKIDQGGNATLPIAEHLGRDKLFHEIILRESGNRRLCKAIDEAAIIVLALANVQERAEFIAQQIRMTDEQHGDILAAIRAGDPRAARLAMRVHVVAAKGVARQYYQ
jgi:DNA-binding GntR family transcriptional regulator